MALRDVLLAFTLATLWGSTFTVMKIGVIDMPPLLANALRFLFSAFPAILFIPRPKVALWTIFAFGLVLGVVKFSILFTSLSLGMPAGLASIVLQVQVFFTILFAYLLLGERPGRMQKIGAAIAFLGMVLFGIDKLAGATLLPFLLAILAAATWGVANIIVKKAQAKDMLAFVVWTSAVAGPVLLALSLLVDGPARVGALLLPPSWNTIWVTLYLALLAQLFGYSVWNSLISRYPVALVGPFALLIPISGMICGMIFLGETISALALMASAIVFLGLMVNVFGDRLANRLRERA
jgi:O-acetylserine/cysteine efflux transporter